MGKVVREKELPLARKTLEKAGVYIANESDIDRLADIAADAYSDYPLHMWFSGGQYDAETTRLIIKASLKTMQRDALICVDSEEMNGFAVWMPPGFTGTKTLPFIFSGGIKLIFRSGLGIIDRLTSYEKLAMRLKKEITDNCGWYLYNLTIRRASQGKGMASKLLLPMLNFCDSEDMVAYLETNKAQNVPLYEHYGFKLERTEKVPRSDVVHYAMARKPLPMA